MKILIVWFTYTALFKGTKKFLRLLVIAITWSYEQDLNVLGIIKMHTDLSFWQFKPECCLLNSSLIGEIMLFYKQYSFSYLTFKKWHCGAGWGKLLTKCLLYYFEVFFFLRKKNHRSSIKRVKKSFVLKGKQKEQLFFLILNSCLWQGLCLANELQKTWSQTDKLSLKKKLHKSKFRLYLN